jgi:ligand-binding sensor domain-containing protein
MACRLVRFFITLTTCLTSLGDLTAQTPNVSRIMTVRDGLPQSYVSGFFQDSNGFLWIATLNGLGRYDGRGFTNYRHTSADTLGLSGNIILYLFNAGNDDLLLCYMDGRMDLLNTITGKVTHVWKSKGFELLVSETGYFKSLIRNSRGVCWMMAADGGSTGSICPG